MANRRFLGITVLGDFILSEGVEAVVENLRRVGATAAACNPTVTAPAPEGEGSFQPPIDAGASPRVFDRSLFGKTSLWVRGGVSYRPNEEFYADSSYAPRQPNELTAEHGEVIGRFIDAAVDAGIKVYFQVGSAQPSGLRDEDKPRLPNGELATNRLANTGSLASKAVRSYNRAYIRDLLAAYPKISGFRPDWPEYPCYTLGEVFADFSPHAIAWAEQHGFDIESIRRDVGALWDHLHGGLSNDDLAGFADPDRGMYSMISWLGRYPGVAGWLRMKAELSADMLREWREAITEWGGPEYELSANAFMPPYTLLTGLDFARAAVHCDAVSPKLYTMHWSLMVKFWGDEILAANPDLDETLLARALVALMDISDDPGPCHLDDYGYPAPDEPHPIPNEPQVRKIAKVCRAIAGQADVTPLVHGYGPPDDFRRRLQLVADSKADGVWINRYGYLGEEKLDAITDVWK
jgi:hypothetical protein